MVSVIILDLLYFSFWTSDRLAYIPAQDRMHASRRSYPIGDGENFARVTVGSALISAIIDSETAAGFATGASSSVTESYRLWSSGPIIRPSATSSWMSSCMAS